LIESRSEINRLGEWVEPALCDLWSGEFWASPLCVLRSWFSQAGEPESFPKVRNYHAAEVDGNDPPGGGMLWEENSSWYISPNIQLHADLR